VDVVNDVFTPDAEEIAYHEALVAAVEAGVARGEGAVRFRGEHVDLAHAEQAKEWLAHARRVRREQPDVG
jgi:citrate lyase subunit beta/citryl-CoA lyase